MNFNFQNWVFKRLLSEMTERQAEDLLNSRRGDPELDIKYRRLAMNNHPDRGGDTDLMKKINTAYQILSSKVSPASNQIEPSYKGQSDSFKSKTSFTGVEECKNAIEEKSKTSGPTKPYVFWIWDGDYFIGSFSANTNANTFGFAGETIQNCINKLRKNYKAIFVDVRDNQLLLIRLNGKDVSHHQLIYSHESNDGNPGNDSYLIDTLREQLPED